MMPLKAFKNVGRHSCIDGMENSITLKDRFARQNVLVGPAGQERLAKSRVLVAGVGGLGSAASYYLALSGVGSLRLVDGDVVESTNLNRQLLFEENNLGVPKVVAAKRRLEKINSTTKVEVVYDPIKPDNVMKLLEDVDVVVDGLDNMTTRQLLNEACVAKRIPYVFGAAVGWLGMISTFTPANPKSCCLHCIFPKDLGDDLKSRPCEREGIMGTVAGVVGCVEAGEAIKIIARVDKRKLLENRILYFDGKTSSFEDVPVLKNPECSVCVRKEYGKLNNKGSSAARRCKH